jgi:hypothetical protein
MTSPDDPTLAARLLAGAAEARARKGVTSLRVGDRDQGIALLMQARDTLDMACIAATTPEAGARMCELAGVALPEEPLLRGVRNGA